MASIFNTTTYILVGVVFALFIILLIAYKAFYRKVAADNALVVSGGKKKRAYFGGKLINPITCKTSMISLNTMNLQVERQGQDALITKDSLRVDIVAEFFIRVQPNEEDVLAAAASLGDRILSPGSVSELLEGKLVGALRSVAATMELQELHEKRMEFADQVQEASTEDLKENGFTLETVSITNLDQTELSLLNPDNRFDATAIQTIKGEVEAKQTRTKEIEEENRVLREDATLRAELGIQEKTTQQKKASYELEQGRAVAEQLQLREIETNRLEEQQAVKEASEKQTEAVEQARIAQEEAVKQREIEREKAVEAAEIARTKEIETARVEQEEAVKQREIERGKAIETAEVERKQAVELARVTQEQAVETAEIERKRTVEVAAAESRIAVAERETAREEADQLKLVASALRAEAEEKVVTAKEVEEARREKEVALVAASQNAEAALIVQEKAADAEAYKVTRVAEAQLEAAQHEADAIKLLAAAELEKARALAEGKEKMVEAENRIDPKIISKDITIALIEQLPAVAEQLMKPAEQIESIRILDLGGGGGLEALGGGSFGRVAKGILGAGAALPVLKEVLGATGIDASDLVEQVSKLIPDLGKIFNEGGPQVVVNVEKEVEAPEDEEAEESSEPTEKPGYPEGLSGFGQKDR